MFSSSINSALSSNSQKLYEALVDFKKNYEECKTTTELKEMMELGSDCSLYSYSAELSEWKYLCASLVKLINRNNEKLEILRKIQAEIEKFSRSVAKESHKITKNPLSSKKNKLPKMLMLTKLADNCFASNEIEIEKDGKLSFRLNGIKYVPDEELIEACFVPQKERKQLDHLLKLVDKDFRASHFRSIQKDIIMNIGAKPVVKSSTLESPRVRTSLLFTNQKKSENQKKMGNKENRLSYNPTTRNRLG